MGTHGLCARVQVSMLAAGRRGRRVLAPFVVSIGLLPALAACSAFSSSPPNASSAVAGQSAAPSGSAPAVANAAAAPSVPTYTPSTPAVVGTGYASAAAAVTTTSGPPTEDTGPSGIFVDLFRSNPPPSAQTAAAPSPPGTYTPSAQTAAAPPPRTYAPSAPPAVAGTGYASAAAAVTTTSGPPAEDTGPSGLLVNLFRFNSTPPAAPSNMPHPPSTYTASAPPYTPPPGQPAAPPPPPPPNSAQ